MNQQERNDFWETLISLEGADMKNEINLLNRKVFLPKYLYRYRSVSVRSIDALQQNLVSFSNAKYYDDPFDTLLQIDFNRIKENGREYLSSQRIIQRIQILAGSLPNSQIEALIRMLSTVDHEKIIAFAVDNLRDNIQSLLKESLWTTCFSESGNNEVMWLKYADQYRGFCLVYDLTDKSNDLCGTKEKCKTCIVNQAGTFLYPVYYSNKGYDATDYSMNLMSVLMSKYLVDKNILPMSFLSQTNISNLKWEPIRAALIKSKCHEYDMEWRMILRDFSSNHVMKEWTPYGVIIGLKTSINDKKTIIRSSKLAGIKHIFESYINDEYKLEFREVSV